MLNKSIYNTIKPTSPDKLLSEYVPLMPEVPERKDNYSNIHDCIISNILQHIKLYGDQDAYNKLWVASLFPERLTKAILRAMEQYIDSNPTTNDTNK